MSKEKKNKVVPDLRFEEFRKADGWHDRLIGEITQVTSGGTPESSNPKYWNGNIPWMNSGELNNKRVHSVSNKITSLGLKESSTKLIPPNCVLIGLAGQGKTRGTTAINYIELCTNQSIAAIHPNYEIFDSEFLYHRIDFMYDELRALSTGDGGRGGLNLEIIKSIRLFLPSLKEQQKIASCLSSLDDLITAHTQKLDALKAHKKGLMQQLFPAEGATIPRLRFEEFKDSREWEEVTLIDTVDKNIKWSFTGGPFGSNLKASDYIPNGVRVIQLQNIGDGEFYNEYKIFTSEEKADQLLSCNIYPGEIILSKMGDPVGRACLIPNTHNRYIMCSDGIRLVIDEKKYSKYFIYTLINSKHFRPLVEKTATGSTRKRIGLDDLKMLPMIVPKNLKEQQKIATCLSSLDTLITAQAEKIAQLKLHKKGLMQGLFPSITDSN